MEKIQNFYQMKRKLTTKEKKLLKVGIKNREERIKEYSEELAYLTEFNEFNEQDQNKEAEQGRNKKPKMSRRQQAEKIMPQLFQDGN